MAVSAPPRINRKQLSGQAIFKCRTHTVLGTLKTLFKTRRGYNPTGGVTMNWWIVFWVFCFLLFLFLCLTESAKH